MFETTNQKIVPKSETGRYRPILVVVTYINYSFDQQFGWFNPHVGLSHVEPHLCLEKKHRLTYVTPAKL